LEKTGCAEKRADVVALSGIPRHISFFVAAPTVVLTPNTRAHCNEIGAGVSRGAYYLRHLTYLSAFTASIDGQNILTHLFIIITAE
jgi:hypothetical protein